MGKKKFAKSEKGLKMDNNKQSGQNKMGAKMDNNSSIKKKRPKSKKVVKANDTARLAFAMGEVAKTSEVIKKQRDARTLYLRFQNQLPSTDSEVKELHSDIKFVRVPRKNKDDSFNYCFLEFGSEQECTKAKNKLATTKLKGEELYVDFVGDKSKGKSSAKKEPVDPTSKGAINPYRLLVSGLAPGVKANDLKSMFPKASKAEIPQSSIKKGSTYGFVQFSEPAHAKAAFDDAQNLNIDGHHITVLYAKRSEGLEEIRKKKELKRKATLNKKKEKNKKQKMEEGSDGEKENRKVVNDDSSDEESDEEQESEDKDGSSKVVTSEDKIENDTAAKNGEDDNNESGEENDDDSEDEEDKEKTENNDENDEDSDEESEQKMENACEEGEDSNEENDEDSDEEETTQIKGNNSEEKDEEGEEKDEGGEDSDEEDEESDEDDTTDKVGDDLKKGNNDDENDADSDEDEEESDEEDGND